MLARLLCSYTRLSQRALSNCNTVIRGYSQVAKANINNPGIAPRLFDRWSCVSSNISVVIRDYSQATKMPINKAKFKPAVKFAGYEIIYVFPQIKILCALLATTRKLAFTFGISIIMCGSLAMFDVMSIEPAVLLTFFAILIAPWAYGFCRVTQNTVGFVYYNNDKKVVLSYVNIKGRRVDHETTVDDIFPFKKKGKVPNLKLLNCSFYSQDLRLQLHLKDEYIKNKEAFEKLFGSIK